MAQPKNYAASFVEHFGTRKRKRLSGTLYSSLTYFSLSLSVLYTQYAGLQITACPVFDTCVDLLEFEIG